MPTLFILISALVIVLERREIDIKYNVYLLK